MPGRYQSAHMKNARKNNQPTPEAARSEPLNFEQARIRQWLQQVRFRRAVVGGVSEADVWKKLGELNGLYEAALAAERARYDALLQEHMDRVRQQLAVNEPAEQGRAEDEDPF